MVVRTRNNYLFRCENRAHPPAEPLHPVLLTATETPADISAVELNIANERFTVVVKTLNLEISRCHLTDHVKELYKSACRTCSTIIFPHSTNQIIVFWRRHCRCRRPCLSSLMAQHTPQMNEGILLMIIALDRRHFLQK